MVKLYKDGDKMAISTDAKNERQFLDEMSFAIEGFIDDGCYKGDYYFQFSYWLPLVVEICCKYRGYKANIEERRVLVAGDKWLDGTEPSHVIQTNPQDREKEETIHV